MRRMLVAIVALGALLASGVAYAATLNTYTASLSGKAKGAAKALPLVQKVGAKGTGGSNAQPLTDIKITIGNAKLTTKGFATCSVAKIAKAQNDSVCPKGALVATGPVTAVLWSPASPSGTTPCNPVLDTWNGGNGTTVNFFKLPAGHACAGLSTGQVAPWGGKIKQSGSSVIDDTPLPPPVSTNAGGLGLYSSLLSETVKFTALTAGKKAFLASSGCKGTRKYSFAITATNGKIKQTSTVSGKTAC